MTIKNTLTDSQQLCNRSFAEVLTGAATATRWEDPEEQTKIVYGVAHTGDNNPHSSHRCRTIAQKTNCQGLRWHATQVLNCFPLSPTIYHLFIANLRCQIVLYNPTSIFHKGRPSCLTLTILLNHIRMRATGLYFSPRVYSPVMPSACAVPHLPETEFLSSHD